MAAAERPERVRVSNRSVVLFAALVALTLLLLRMASSAARVIGWMLVAVAIAGLLDGPVRRLTARGWKRGRAVLVVYLIGVACAGLVSYRVVDDVRRGNELLRASGPAAAVHVEESERFGEVARTVKLHERTERFLKDLPAKLRGGTAGEAFRAAATRGVAALTTNVLTLFLLLHGPKLAEAALRQVPDERRRRRTGEVALAAYERGFGYLRGTLLTALLAGAVAYVAAVVADVPGAAPLALWVALWDVVPILGAAIGAAPLVLLATVDDPVKGAVLAAVFVAYQLTENFVAQPRLEDRTMRLGPFLTVAAGFAGLELRGLPGALIALLAVATAVAAADELAPQPG